jgi:hypothetical protein
MSYRIPNHPFVEMFEGRAAAVVNDKKCKKTSEAATAIYSDVYTIPIISKLEYVLYYDTNIAQYINGLLSANIAMKILSSSDRDEFLNLEMDGYQIGSLSETIEKVCGNTDDSIENKEEIDRHVDGNKTIVPAITSDNYPELKPVGAAKESTKKNKNKNKKKVVENGKVIDEIKVENGKVIDEIKVENGKVIEDSDVEVKSIKVIEDSDVENGKVIEDSVVKSNKESKFKNLKVKINEIKEDMIITSVPKRHLLSWADAEDEVDEAEEEKIRLQQLEKQKLEKVKAGLDMATRIKLADVNSVDEIERYLEEKKKVKEAEDRKRIEIEKIAKEQRILEDKKSKLLEEYNKRYISTTPKPLPNNVSDRSDTTKWKTSSRWYLARHLFKTMSNMTEDKDKFAWKCDANGYPIGWTKIGNRWLSDHLSNFIHVELSSNKWTTLEVTYDTNGNVIDEKQVSVEYFFWASLPPKFRISHVAPNSYARDFISA